MRGANLSGANLQSVKHLDATLGKALFDVDTLFPADFNPAARGWVLVDHLR